FAYIGSRFISVDESGAYEKYKDMVIDSDIDDIIYTDAISGINGNYLIPSIEQAGMDPKNLPKPEKVNFDKTNQSRAKAWKDIWGAGQGVGMIEDANQCRKQWRNYVWSMNMRSSMFL